MHEPLPRDDYSAPLTATRLETPPPAPSARMPRARPSTFAYSVLGMMCVGVVAVFLWLPRWVDTARTEAPAALPATPPPSPLPAEPAALLVPEPPDSRPAAQDALAALLPQVAALRARSIDTWGSADLARIETAIGAGERAYREQRFTAARQAYARAAEEVAATTARIPEVVAAYLDEGARALLSQDARAAEKAYGVALALAPDHPDAQRGLRRAESFDRVLALLTEAQGFERMGDEPRAAVAYREALKLDPEASAARQALERLARARADAAFTALMSKGFAALQNGDYAQAETAFTQATRQRPNAAEAANALAQTRARATAARIENALDAAQRAERREAWNEAGAQYRAALALDQALATAVQGNARAAARAQLDARLRATLQRPERLTDDAVYRAAEADLQEARAIPHPGPRLAEQARSLQAALAAARTPIAVTLRSDAATDVTILKVGRLGRLTAHKLTLFPGRYTALGTRAGFRDARVEFTVAADGAAPVITVQCQEALSFGR